MNVTAIIVTYGDRFSLLKQVIEGVLLENVSEVWVVDNNSTDNSLKQLHDLESSIDNIKVFYNKENKGTAGAYFDVLEYAYKYYSDQFLWFLDDDNLPLAGSLKSLKDTYFLFASIHQRPVLYSYRGSSWVDDRTVVERGLIKGPVQNSFCGFNWKNFVNDKFKKKPQSGNNDICNYPLVKVNWGPYGGLFTHIDNLKRIGLPNKDMIVYADDHEFTNRFVSHDIPQYLVYFSQLRDIDMTIVEGGGYFSEKTSPFKLFYGLRNTTFLSRCYRNNLLKYNLNKILFISLLSIQAFKFIFFRPKLVKNRVILFTKAIIDGENGKLGKNYDL